MKMCLLCIVCVAAGYIMRYSQDIEKMEECKNGK